MTSIWMVKILFVIQSVYLNAFMQTYRPESLPKSTHISKPTESPIHTHAHAKTLALPLSAGCLAAHCLHSSRPWTRGLVCLCVHLSVCLRMYWCIQWIECDGKSVCMCACVKLCIKGYSCVCLRVIILLRTHMWVCVCIMCVCLRHRLQMGLMHVGG